MKTRSILRFLIISFITTIIFSTNGMAKDVVLKAKKISGEKSPKIDGIVDKIWKKARRTKIVVKGEGEKEINAKVLYTDQDVYFLFQWKDKTESLNRVYTFKNGKWKKKKGNEDRFNLAWDIKGNIKGFAQKGCQVLCHKGEDDSFMATNGPGEKADLWHWKAQRTNPVGYADDQFIQSGSESDQPAHEHADEASGHETAGILTDKIRGGGYTNNWDKAKNRPLNIGAGKGGPVLLKTKARKVIGSTTFKDGLIVPREILLRAAGSRGDIEARGVWKKGRWTLELKRALNTGHDDDVQFVDLKKAYFFGISVHENGDGEKHATAQKPAQLQFK